MSHSKGLAITKWLAVNGGVLAVASLVTAVEGAVKSATGSDAAAAVIATAALYLAVFFACKFNLRGRRRLAGDEQAMRPIALSSCFAHPLGSACERYIHAHTLLAAPQAALGGGVLSSAAWLDAVLPLPVGASAGALASGWGAALVALRCGAMLTQLVGKLFFFELAFDGFFYAAHRCRPLEPRARGRAPSCRGHRGRWGSMVLAPCAVPSRAPPRPPPAPHVDLLVRQARPPSAPLPSHP